MSIDYKTLFTILPHVFEAKFPVLLRGRHGIGKSTVVYQQAKALGLRASQMTEGDLLGLPKIDGNVTAWLAPEWLDTACKNPVVLFLDEVDRATLEVRQGIFELCDSRKIAGHTLHPDTLIFACVNGGKHGAEYQVNEFDPAELDRYTVFDVEPTVEDWLEWAKGNVIDEISLTITTITSNTKIPSSLTRYIHQDVVGSDYLMPYKALVRSSIARPYITLLIVLSALRVLWL